MTAEKEARPINELARRVLQNVQISSPTSNQIKKSIPDLRGIPERYRQARLADFDGIKVDWNKGGFFLSGPTGIGKTHLATAILVDRIKDQEWLWISVPELMLRIRSSFDAKSETSEMQVVDRYSKVPLLLLDDLGAEKRSDYSVSTFYLILSNRINRMRETIVTTEMGLDRIHRWQPRIASRLASFQKIKLPDVDRRMK